MFIEIQLLGNIFKGKILYRDGRLIRQKLCFGEIIFIPEFQLLGFSSGQPHEHTTKDRLTLEMLVIYFASF